MLNKRQEKIIMIMQENTDWIIGKELAKVLGVSDRTIRSDIAQINNFYEDVLIESSIKQGYRMNEDKLQRLDIELGEIIPQTSEERCIYIIKELLFKQNEINLTFLQDKVFVSDYSMDNDIKKIRKMIEPYESLQLIRSKNYISLSGKEEEKRKLYKHLLEKETKGNFLNLNKVASFYKNFDLIRVKNLLEETFEEFNYGQYECEFPILINHIGIYLERIMRNNFIKVDQNTEELKNCIEYKIAEEFYKKVAKEIRIKIIQDEIVLLALLLLGKKRTDYTNTVIKYEVIYPIDDLIAETFIDIKNIFDIDFTRDNELINGLTMHIMSLIERYMKNISIDNMYLQEIKHKYPLVFEMAVSVCKLLEEKIHINIKENDIAFIAIHLGAACARTDLTYKYKAVIIYPHNEALSDLCLQKIRSRFDERMEIIECMSFFEKAAIINLKPDLILTTLPLKHDLEVLTVKISLFVNYEDESRIFQALNNLDRIRCQEDFELLVLRLIKEEFFYRNIEVNNPVELITKMSDNLYAKEYVKDSFKNSVLKREEMSATSFNYGFAIPHSLSETCINHSALSIAILDKPIKWGEFDVRLVILFAINNDDRKVLKIFFDWLNNVISNSNQFAKLLKVNNYKEFIDEVLK